MRFNFGGWIAPEVINGQPYDQCPEAVDVFSFGILLCEVISGLQVEELPRLEGEQYAHMGIGSVDAPALREALAPFVEEGAPQVVRAPIITIHRARRRGVAQCTYGKIPVVSVQCDGVRSGR
jgi:hypothetical protein